MYAGTTYGKRSGQLIGVHQRIDREARRHIKPLLPGNVLFPTINEILHFEGNNGPDGIKRKSPSIDEPWHFINPDNSDDRSLLTMIFDHQINLGLALKKKNHERAAFEAAWMAHAIVDGLTPAHHFPLAEKIEELFGMPHHERTSIKEKNIIKGTSRRDTLSKNWQYWGKRGIFMNHFMFEFGVATAILGKNFGTISISDEDVIELKTIGYEKVFLNIMQHIVILDMYKHYAEKGWDRQLANTVRTKLVPLIVKAVVLGWYEAITQSEKTR